MVEMFDAPLWLSMARVAQAATAEIWLYAVMDWLKYGGLFLCQALSHVGGCVTREPSKNQILERRGAVGDNLRPMTLFATVSEIKATGPRRLNCQEGRYLGVDKEPLKTFSDGQWVWKERMVDEVEEEGFCVTRRMLIVQCSIGPAWGSIVFLKCFGGRCTKPTGLVPCAHACRSDACVI